MLIFVIERIKHIKIYNLLRSDCLSDSSLEFLKNDVNMFRKKFLKLLLIKQKIYNLYEQQTF